MTNREDENEVRIIDDSWEVSMLMVCICDKCDKLHPRLEDLKGMNIVLHHVNEEDNELGLKDDIVRTPIEKLISQQREEAYAEGYEKAMQEFSSPD